MKRTAIFITVLVTLAVAFLPAPLVGRSAAPAQAQGSTSWYAEYYNNGFLSGTPAITRQEGALGINWGAGSPGSGVNADNWSARFASDPYFNAGVYRFYILADDGVKLWIDFPPDKRPTIDTYDQPRPGTTLTADVTMTAGYHHIQVDFRENTGEAYLYVTWEPLSGSPTGPNFPKTPTPPPSSGIVWIGQYYNNGALAGAPVATINEGSPSHNWGLNAPLAGLPADLFSVRWTAYPYLNAGTYTITTRADDGVRVYVNGVLLINEFHGATGQTYTATFNLTAGQHSIVVEYYDYTQAAFLEFNLAGGGSPQPGGPTATVSAYLLNVRAIPNAFTGQILTKIRRGETYPVVGRTGDSSWWQINVNGLVGWVSGRYVTTRNTQNVPVTYNPGGGQPTPVPSTQCPGFLPSRLRVGGWGRVTPGDPNNLRAQPSFSGQWLGQIPGGGVFQVLAGPVCGNSGAWWQVYYNGITGWTMEGQYGVYWLEPY